MKYYFAPLEGITGYVYRNAYEKVFGNIDKYFAPFIVPTQSKKFKTREIRDILPENNDVPNLVPQVLTNNAEHFINTASKVKLLGYEEININLGCPSGTVVAKDKGSGFLAKTQELDRFLDDIFKAQEIKISVKTRIGKDDPEEFYRLLEIYNQYPLEELIIHLRTQKDFYRNDPNLDMYKHALDVSANPICYNGDIFNVNDSKEIIKKFPTTDRIMLARGIISNPGLMCEIKGQDMMTKEKLKLFLDEILNGYKEVFNNDEKLVMFKMKEIWAYMSWMFTNHDKYIKEIRKSQSFIDYKIAVSNLLRNEELIKGARLFDKK